MASSIRSRISLCLALLMWAGGAGAAKDLAEEKARAELKKAQQAYDLGEFEPALRAFSEAYRLKPLPGFLFNLGQCHRQLGHYDRASFFYRRFLELSPTKPSNAAVVQELIGEMEEKQRAQQAAPAKEPPPVSAAPPKALAAVPAPVLEPAPTPSAPIVATEPSGAAPAAALEVHAPAEPAVPLYRRPWVWVGAGAVAVAAIAGASIAASAPHRSKTTLGEIDASR